MFVGAGFLVAIVPLFYGGIGILVMPFMESAIQGLLCMFVPIYPLVYLITRWDAMKGVFTAYAFGIAAIVGTLIGGAAMFGAPGGGRFGPQTQVNPNVPGFPGQPGAPGNPPPLIGAEPGAGEGDLDAIVGEVVDLTEQVGTLLEGVQDPNSARAATPRFKELSDRLDQLHAKARAMGGFSNAGVVTNVIIGVKYGTRLREGNAKYKREFERIQRDRPLRLAFKEATPGHGPIIVVGPDFRGGGPPPNFAPPQPPNFAPPQPGNADSITLQVTGLVDKETEDAFNDKLNEMLRAAYGNYHTFGTGGAARKTITVSPIPDVKVFADRITWAKVTRIDGRVIEVAMAPLAAGQRRPADSDWVGQVLFDLKSPTLQRRKDALRRLSEAPPDEARRVEVAKAIEPVLKDPDGFARSDAAKALGVWGGKENVPALIQALRDPAFNVVWAVFDALERLKDPSSADPVAAFLGTPQNRGNAAKVLKAIGAPAEPAVIKYLQAGDPFVRMEAANILKEIGTEACVPALQDLIRRTNNHGLDAMAAGDALDSLGAARFAQPARGKGGLVPKSKTRR
jgi:hypothetical protein